MKIDPIHQFNIEPLFTIGHIGNHTIAFTNSSLYMFITVAVISLLMIGSMARGQLVPGRMQSIAEISYEFVASTIRSTRTASSCGCSRRWGSSARCLRSPSSSPLSSRQAGRECAAALPSRGDWSERSSSSA